MDHEFRIIDSGIREGRLQIAYDQALVELHQAMQVRDTIRFLRFPPTVLIGRHQVLSHEVKLDHCRSAGIGIVRRITGGGAIYLDDNQVGWELVFSRSSLPMNDLGAYTKTICEAVTLGLSSAFGIDARFRPRNDIEVDGKKLCGTGGFFDGDTLIYQGTVLVDVDPAAMMACLNVPEAKIKKRNLDRAEQRITTLQALLGKAPSVDAVHQAILKGFCEHLGIVGRPEEISAMEEARTGAIYDEEIGTDAFVTEIDARTENDMLSAERVGPGGTVTAYVRTEGPQDAKRIREVLLTGDFFVTPPRTVLDLEAALRGVPVRDAGAAIDRFFECAKVELLTISKTDFREVVESALSGQFSK